MTLPLVPLAAGGGVFALVLLFLIFAAVGTAIHASDNGHNPLLWFVVVLLTGVIGILIYVVIDHGDQQQLQCQHCGYWNPANTRYCGGCGTDFGTQQPRGPNRTQRGGGGQSPGQHGLTDDQRRPQSQSGPGQQNQSWGQQGQNQQQDGPQSDHGFDT